MAGNTLPDQRIPIEQSNLAVFLDQTQRGVEWWRATQRHGGDTLETVTQDATGVAPIATGRGSPESTVDDDLLLHRGIQPNPCSVT